MSYAVEILIKEATESKILIALHERKFSQYTIKGSTHFNTSPFLGYL